GTTRGGTIACRRHNAANASCAVPSFSSRSIEADRGNLTAEAGKPAQRGALIGVFVLGGHQREQGERVPERKFTGALSDHLRKRLRLEQVAALDCPLAGNSACWAERDAAGQTT